MVSSQNDLISHEHKVYIFKKNKFPKLQEICFYENNSINDLILYGFF
jgi:hypothetical protein